MHPKKHPPPIGFLSWKLPAARRLVRYYWYPAMIIHANPQKTLAIAIRVDLDDFA